MSSSERRNATAKALAEREQAMYELVYNHAEYTREISKRINNLPFKKFWELPYYNRMEFEEATGLFPNPYTALREWQEGKSVKLDSYRSIPINNNGDLIISSRRL